MCPRHLLAVLAVVVLAGCTVSISDTPGDTGAEPIPTITNGSTISVPDGERVSVEVIDVVDGDTIDVRMPDGSEDTVRLVGVDTPEVHVENDPAEFERIPDTRAGATCLREAGQDASAYVKSRVARGTSRWCSTPRPTVAAGTVACSRTSTSASIISTTIWWRRATLASTTPISPSETPSTARNGGPETTSANSGTARRQADYSTSRR